MGTVGQPFFELVRANVWRADVLALRDLSLSLSTGEHVAILGPNGAGKSSLLKLMTGEVRAEARAGATCRLFGEDHWCLEELRHRIGLVMPEEVARFHPDEIACDVVRSSFRAAYGRTGDMRFSSREKSLAGTAMDACGIGNLAGRRFGELSSGEKRRFLIARAMVHEPEVLVLDEPSTALDFAARIAMLESLRAVSSRQGTLIMVTHDPAEIPPEIGRIILLQHGDIIADGPKLEILSSERLAALYRMPLKVTWSDGWAMVRPRK